MDKPGQYLDPDGCHRTTPPRGLSRGGVDRGKPVAAEEPHEHEPQKQREAVAGNVLDSCVGVKQRGHGQPRQDRSWKRC